MARWLSAHRDLHDRRPWQRAATPFAQAVLALRWFKDATDLPPILARDAKVSVATAYRYVLEAIDVIAAQAPELPTCSPTACGRDGSSFAWTAHLSQAERANAQLN